MLHLPGNGRPSLLTGGITCAGVAQALVGNDDGVLGQQRHMAHVIRPHTVLDEGRAQLSNGVPLLDIKEHNLHNKASAACSAACAQMKERLMQSCGEQGQNKAGFHAIHYDLYDHNLPGQRQESRDKYISLNHLLGENT